MFTRLPTAIAHKSCADQGMYVTPEYIVSTVDGKTHALKKFCPHRQYPLATTGEHTDKLECKLHGFAFNPDGTPINNNRSLGCTNISVGKSGIVFRDFVEPDHQWVDDLAAETNLKFSHMTSHTSNGSWLWNMELAVDLLHLRTHGIHPLLSKQFDTDDVVLDQGDGWALQIHKTGWWLQLFPFTFIEYGNPGCLAVNYVVPKDVNNEYGFDWYTQFYYDARVHVNDRVVFETFDTTYSEDVVAVELQNGNYTPLVRAHDRLETQCVNWGDWYIKNLIK